LRRLCRGPAKVLLERLLFSVHSQVMVRDRGGEESIVPQKRYRPEENVSKLREAEVLIGQSKKVPEAVKAIGISEAHHYRWPAEEDGREEGWEARRAGPPTRHMTGFWD